MLKRQGLFVILVMTSFAIARGYSGGDVQISLDAARFQDSKRNPCLEIYYSLTEQSIMFAPNAKGESACRVVMNLLVFKDDSLWASKVWKIEKVREEEAALDEKEIIDMFRYYVDVPASYRVVIQARDLNQEDAIDSVETAVECGEFSTDRVEVSDVQFASKIKRMDNTVSRVFAKKNYAVVPNPRQVFGEGLPNLYYYFESYNLLDNVSGTRYKRLAYLKDSGGNLIERLGNTSRIRKKVYDMGVEMGMINISQVPTGQYAFVYGIEDSAGNVLVTKEKSVFIFNPAVRTPPVASRESRFDVNGALMEEIARLDAQQLDKEFGYMIYLTENEELLFYKNLNNADAKRQYIASIWQSKARLEGLKAVDYRRLYMSRVREATGLYKGAGGKGWKTDQGRVFILYGPPTDILRIRSSSANRPYQIWTYDNLRGQGGVQFIFADRFGFSRYELIHSDLRGELQDPNWQRFVIVGNQQNVLDRN